MKRLLIVDDDPDMLAVLRDLLQERYEVTANAETLVAEDCLKSGAFAWVPKPFDLAYMDHIAATATEQKLPGR